MASPSQDNEEDDVRPEKRLRPTEINEAETGHVQPTEVARHYSSRHNQTRDERERSPIIHLKKLNNWVKSVLIRKYSSPGTAVLDLACGKGGDLIKWDKAKIAFYAGIDIAAGSIEDARVRYNGETSYLNTALKSFPFHFRAVLITGDAFEVSLEDVLGEEKPFDVCSCQFAFHYSFDSERRARRALRNISFLLRPGGYFIGTTPDANVIVRKLRAARNHHFGNSVYGVRFEEAHYSDDQYAKKLFPSDRPFGNQYMFHLEDAVDIPEHLVPFSTFQELAEEYGLELVSRSNFHDFVHQHSKDPQLVELMENMGLLRNGALEITADEWDAAYLYLTFVFKKAGDVAPSKIRKRNEEYQPIPPEDVRVITSPDAT